MLFLFVCFAYRSSIGCDYAQGTVSYFSFEHQKLQVIPGVQFNPIVLLVYHFSLMIMIFISLNNVTLGSPLAYLIECAPHIASCRMPFLRGMGGQNT